MASLLVLIEPVGSAPHPASLEVLGQARRIGTSLGATVYAVAPCVRAPLTGQETIIEVLSSHGADKVILAASPSCVGAFRWGSHGSAFQAACDLVRPSLVLAADTLGARDLAGRLASHLGAAWLADAWVEHTDEGLVLWEGSGDGARQLLGDGGAGTEFSVVATVPPGRYPMAHGDEEAEVEVIEAAAVARDFIDEGEVGRAPRALVVGALAHAAALVAALDGDGSGDSSATATLAIALDGEAAALGGTGAITRAALGPGASSCAAAHYAVEGDAEALGRALAAALVSEGEAQK